MNATQKMIAAVAIVAVLAVAAVGAGFAYTASTSNSGNDVESVFFKLSQGNEVSSYTDSFDVDITYDSITFIDGLIDDLDDDMDPAILAIEEVSEAQEAYLDLAEDYLGAYKAVFASYEGDAAGIAADEGTAKIADMEAKKAIYEQDPTDETAAADYLAAYKVIFPSYEGEASGIENDTDNQALLTALATEKEDYEDGYDDAVAAFILVYNTNAAVIATQLTINSVLDAEGQPAGHALFETAEQQETATDRSVAMTEYVTAYKAIFTTYTGDAIGIAADAGTAKIADMEAKKAIYEQDPTDETAAADYLAAYKVIFPSYEGEASGIENDTDNQALLTALATKKAAFEAALGQYGLYYNLSGSGKVLTVSVSADEDEIPAYWFKVSATGLNTADYNYVVGVQFGDSAMTYKVFTGEEISFQNTSTDVSNITLKLFLEDEGTADDSPAGKPYTDLQITFTVDSEE